MSAELRSNFVYVCSLLLRIFREALILKINKYNSSLKLIWLDKTRTGPQRISSMHTDEKGDDK
jgi:hypothetical protein